MHSSDALAYSRLAVLFSVDPKKDVRVIGFILPNTKSAYGGRRGIMKE